MANKGYQLTNDSGGISATTNNYAEMYIYEGGTATTIGIVNIYHLIQNFSTGLVNNWTFDAGSNGAISAFADYGGTVAGTVKATDAAHGLITGEVVTISGTTNYNGVFVVTKVDDDNFYFTDTWVADDATGNWYQGSSLKAGTGSAGLYGLLWNASFTSAGNNKVYQLELFQNATEIDKSAAEHKIATGTDIQAMASPMRLVQIADGDYITLAVECITDATNLTMVHAGVSLVRLGL